MAADTMRLSSYSADSGKCQGQQNLMAKSDGGFMMVRKNAKSSTNTLPHLKFIYRTSISLFQHLKVEN